MILLIREYDCVARLHATFYEGIIKEVCRQKNKKTPFWLLLDSCQRGVDFFIHPQNYLQSL
jgi:hypothetical protein